MCVGHEVEGKAVLVNLWRDWESDTYLYGYWCDDLFAKVFVEEKKTEADETWEAKIAFLRSEKEQARQATLEDWQYCRSRVVDGLAQFPNFDATKAVPGVAYRRVVLRRDD
jgi:hypothetical protein